MQMVCSFPILVYVFVYAIVASEQQIANFTEQPIHDIIEISSDSSISDEETSDQRHDRSQPSGISERPKEVIEILSDSDKSESDDENPQRARSASPATSALTYRTVPATPVAWTLSAQHTDHSTPAPRLSQRHSAASQRPVTTQPRPSLSQRPSTAQLQPAPSQRPATTQPQPAPTQRTAPSQRQPAPFPIPLPSQHTPTLHTRLKDFILTGRDQGKNLCIDLERSGQTLTEEDFRIATDIDSLIFVVHSISVNHTMSVFSCPTNIDFAPIRKSNHVNVQLFPPWTDEDREKGDRITD